MNDDVCSICLFEIDGEHQIIILPCTHFFHYKCIKKWVSNTDKNTYVCPICRQSYLKEYERPFTPKPKPKNPQKKNCKCILL